VAAGAVLYARDVDRLARFYSDAFELPESQRDEKFIVLESAAFQLVVLRAHPAVLDMNPMSDPPARRSNVAFKPVFFVGSIAAVRSLCEKNGGVMNAASKEWEFEGWRVCDGVDPEGNVIQVRERL
jgi:predicted enzyme related to lactoylglutathione lyase